MQEVQGQQQQQVQQQAEMEAVKAVPNMMKAPLADPTKNPALQAQLEPPPEM